MVSQAGDQGNQPDFVSQFIANHQNGSTTSTPSQSSLDYLNALPYIAGLGPSITRITKAPDGRRRSYWLHFSNGAIAHVPDIEDLRKVDRMELILSRSLERSVLLQPPKLARQWRQNEASLIMDLAEPAVMPVDTLNAIIEELLADDFLAYQSEGEEMSGRKAAEVFANQAPIEHLERRYVLVPAQGGIYLHRPSLSAVLEKRFHERPSVLDVGAALRYLSYRPTHPYPATHSAHINGNGAAPYTTSVRMWFKPDVGEAP
jgi:hypothetical protein